MVKVVIETPVDLTGRQKELLKEFQQATDEHQKHAPKRQGFFDSVKKFFEDMT